MPCLQLSSMVTTLRNEHFGMTVEGIHLANTSLLSVLINWGVKFRIERGAVRNEYRTFDRP